MRVLVIGGGRVGRELARRLEDRGENVVVIENDDEAIERAREEGYTVQMGDGTDVDTLRAAGADNASTIIAATGNDDTNLLVGRLGTTKFDTDRVICRANLPDNIDAFENLDVDVISSSHAVAQAIDNVIERPAMQQWSENIEEGGDVQEVTVRNEEFVGRTVKEAGTELPGRCLIALITHGDETFVPEANYVLDQGDRITIVGEHDAVRDAMAVCRGK